MGNEKKQPIQITNNTQKRMDDEFHSNTNESLHKVLENRRSILQEDINLTDRNQLSSQDGQAYTASTLNSLRARTDSELNTMYMSIGNLLGKDASSNRTDVGIGPMCFCAPRSSGSLGQKKVDEMIDYTMRNLNEAGKSLTNLGENFEQDLKLMFMDIMGRVQHWVSVVQNRICAASADLELLRKDSIARVSDLIEKELELVDLRKKLSEAEASLASQEKELEVTRKAPANLVEGQRRTSTTAQSNPENGSTTPERNILETGNAVALVDTASQSVEDGEKEKADREVELEEELAQLREENQRLLEERTEYENSVQCALLRGVSSLNVEAFKVLRCPPIPCCSPCAYSPPCSISQEPIVVSCHPRNPAKRLGAVPQPSQRGSKAMPRSEKTDKTRSQNGAGTNVGSQKLSEHLLNFNGGDKMTSENGVVLLLHHGDAENLCQPCMKRHQPETYGSPSNRDNACVGEKCRKPVAGLRDRVSGPRRSSGLRPESCDIHFRSRDETGENGTAKRNAVTAKRCATFDTNRCNRED